jgi:hypothetical protein
MAFEFGESHAILNFLGHFRGALAELKMIYCFSSLFFGVLNERSTLSFGSLENW